MKFSGKRIFIGDVVSAQNIRFEDSIFSEPNMQFDKQLVSKNTILIKFGNIYTPLKNVNNIFKILTFRMSPKKIVRAIPMIEDDRFVDNKRAMFPDGNKVDVKNLMDLQRHFERMPEDALVAIPEFEQDIVANR